MKLVCICPFCESEDFDIYDYRNPIYICEECGEISPIDDLKVKKIEEN